MTEAAPRTWAQRRRLAAAWLHDRRQFAEPRLPRTCPVCGYTRMFISVGHPPRRDARCLNCGSRERHRPLWLWDTEGGGNKLAGKRILHFAPEKVVMRLMHENPAISAPAERHAHFSAEDHVRYYGLDFADRLAEVGFTVITFRLPPEQEVRYGLSRDEWLYVATRRPQ